MTSETTDPLIKSSKLTKDQSSKLSQLITSLPTILSQTDNPDYDEIFGHRINTVDKPYVDELIRNEILHKFLAADNYDIDASTERLINCLNWRNEFQPLSAAFEEKYDSELNELGVITNFKESKLNKVTTWNLYGNLKNPKKIFEKFGGNKSVDLPGSQFLRWRVGLMEKSLQLIDFTSSDGENKIAQVHDYNNVSMFRIDPGMKQATKEIISIFGENYPELLSTKFFINVPLLMGWVFTFFKTLGIISAETLKKFQVLNHGDLSEFFNVSELPKQYGGKVDKTLFAIDIEDNVELSEYGQVILKKIGDEEIKHINDEVE
ncbi:SFH5 Phosphatidylinositol transfer protein SFH5 [Candida maltosa Xu316]